MTYTAARDFYDGRRQSDSQALSHLRHLEPNLPWPPSASQIQAYITQMNLMDLSPSTVRTRISVLRKCFKLSGLLFPDERITLPARSKRPKWVLPEDQEEAFFGHLGECLNADILRFCLEAGLRIEEALRLTPKHFFRSAESTKWRVEVPVNAQTGVGKTQGSNDVIPISLAAMKVALPRIQFLGSASTMRLWPQPYLAILTHFNEAKELMGWTDPTCTPKAMRRTFAWRLLKKGVPVDVIQTLLRHGSLATTSLYLNAIGKADRAAEYI